MAKLVTITKANFWGKISIYYKSKLRETKLANSATITIITGPELVAATGFGTGRLHPGVASAFSMRVNLLQHAC